MSRIRLVLGYMVAAVLAFGYLASQYAYVNGNAAAYAKAVDTPQVKFLCLFLLVGALILAFIPEKETE